MKISKIHQRFSDLLKEPRALTNPEDYLGPNWEDVINFWLYVDGLNVEEMNNMNALYLSLSEDVQVSAWRAAWASAKEVVGEKVTIAACGASYDKTYYMFFGYATYELIAQHKLLEQGKTLVFLPLCLKP
jgi:hypothetical protein